jgi:hypothetical protein
MDRHGHIRRGREREEALPSFVFAISQVCEMWGPIIGSHLSEVLFWYEEAIAPAECGSLASMGLGPGSLASEHAPRC